MENIIICNCKQVSYSDIEHALENHNKMEDVLVLFEEVQRVTHCHLFEFHNHLPILFLL